MAVMSVREVIVPTCDWWRRLACATLTLLLAASASALEAPNLFRSDARHSGVYSSPGPQRLTGVAWRFQTGGPILSSPAVTADTVYVGSQDKCLYAVERAAGRQRWRFETGGAVDSSPAVAGGLVFITSWDGRVYAVDAATGHERWRFETGGEKRFGAVGLYGMGPQGVYVEDDFDYYLSSPLVQAGVVYVGSGDGHVYALDAATGKQRWAFDAKSSWVLTSPAVANGTVFFGTSDSQLFFAVDAATGAKKLEVKAGMFVYSSPALDGQLVYFGACNGRLLALDPTTGERRWAWRAPGSLTNAHLLDAQGDFVGPFNPEPTGAGMRAYMAKVHALGSIISSPVPAGGSLYFGSLDGALYALH